MLLSIPALMNIISFEVINDLKTAAAYIRVSTDDQLELSPDSQLAKILEYAKANEIKVPREFVFIEGEGKKGLSGRKAANRPKFQEMIALAKEKPKPFDCILLWKFSRFARNIDEASYYKSVLRNKCKIDVISVSEPISEGMYGRLVEMIIEWSDEFYSFNLAGEVRRGMCAKARAGEFTAYAPFGYEMKDKMLIPDQKKAATVRKIFNDYASGMSTAEISGALNKDGIRTRFENPIDNRFITYMVTNPVYKGYIAFSTEGKRKKGELDPEKMIISKGVHEPLVSEELWERCYERYTLDYNKKRRPSVNTEYSFRSLIYCDACGSPLTYSGRGHIQCSKYNRGECKSSHYIDLYEAEAEIFKAIRCDVGDGAADALESLTAGGKNAVLLELVDRITAYKTRYGYDLEINYR